MLKRILLSSRFALLLLCLPVLSQTLMALDPHKKITQYSHDVWQIENGLPQNSIQAITQTVDGYLWFGTQEGVVRFDGVRFTVFDTSNTKEISNKNILVLITTKDGSLWCGTDGGGLTQLKDGRFILYTNKDGLPDNTVTALYEDSQGTLWIGTRGGVGRLIDGQFTSFTEGSGVAGTWVYSIAEDADGSILVGTIDGLFKFKDGSWKNYTTKKGLPGEKISSIYKDQENNIWLGTDQGLCLFKEEKFITYSTKDGLLNDVIKVVSQDRERNLWVGTPDGLNQLQYYDGKDAKRTGYDVRDGLSIIGVISIYEDREGSLWVGTYGGGLNRFKDGKFTTYTLQEGLFGNSVTSFYEHPDGSLWSCGLGGISRLKDEKFTTYTPEDGLPEGLKISIFGSKDGSIWIGGGDSGLTRFKDDKFKTYTTKHGLAGNSVFAVYEDTEGTLWIGTNHGLNRFKDGKFTTYTTKHGLSNDRIHTILKAQDGSLWLGTRDGITILRDGQFSVYTTKDGLSNEEILGLYQDREGVMWISTGGGGLNRLKDGQLTVFTTKNGLFNDTIPAMLEDNQGNFWTCSNKGVFRVSKKELNHFVDGKISSITSISYGIADGMRSPECNGGAQNSVFKTKDGRFWFPTIKGIVMIDPNNIKPNTIEPPVIIEQLIVDKASPDISQKVTLAAGSKNFEFQYTALSLQVPERVKFKYKLEGFDQDWVDAGTRRQVFYTNLAPGDYVFRVMASNNDGLWNEAGANISFHLNAFFYQTYWFYALLTIAVVLLGFGLSKQRIVLLKRRNQELEGKVVKRTAGLQLAMEAAEASARAKSMALAELKKAEAEVRNLSMTDDLTGLYNRRGFLIMTEQQQKVARRTKTSYTLIYADMNGLKRINDTFGHQQGSEAIQQIAESLKDSFRESDIVARLGGDEFTMFVSDTNDCNIDIPINRLMENLQRLNLQTTNAYQLSLSIGAVCTDPDDESSIEELLVKADQIMYENKRLHRAAA